MIITNMMLLSNSLKWKPKNWWFLILLAAVTLNHSSCLQSYDPELTPVIASVEPAVIAQGGVTKIFGTNFLFQNAATSIIVVVEGQGDKYEIELAKVEVDPVTRQSFIAINTASSALRPGLEPRDITPGAYDVHVLVHDRDGDRVSNKVSFVVEALRIDGMEPTQGPVGTLIKIKGNGLAGTQKIRFISVESTPIDVDPLPTSTNTEVYVQVPEGARLGNISLLIKDRPSDFLVGHFKVTLPAPTIAAINPAQAPIGTKLIITGTNLGIQNYYSRKVFFTGKNNTLEEAQVSDIFQDWSPTQLIVTVPAKAITGPVIVKIDDVAAQENIVFTLEKQNNVKRLFFTDGAALQVASINEGQPATVVKLFENPDFVVDKISIDAVGERIYASGYNPASNQHGIISLNLDGEDEKVIIQPGADHPWLVLVKATSQYLYWMEVTPVDNVYSFWQANLDGSDAKNIITTADGYISAAEYYQGDIYWISPPFIRKHSTDGAEAIVDLYDDQDVDESNFSALDGAIVKPAQNTIYTSYYTMEGYQGILLGPLDGSGKLTANKHMEQPQSSVRSIGFDEVDNKVYWVAYSFTDNFSALYRSDLDGSNQETIYIETVSTQVPYYGFEIY